MCNTYRPLNFLCLRRRSFSKYRAARRFRETINSALGYFECFFKYLREILILIGYFCLRFVLCLGNTNFLCFPNPEIRCERWWRIFRIDGSMVRFSVLTLLITSLQLAILQFGRATTSKTRRPTIVQKIAEIFFTVWCFCKIKARKDWSWYNDYSNA